jgi:DNA polymerase I-like protein with 3'-5' exonuclease and polymerase domains
MRINNIIKYNLETRAKALKAEEVSEIVKTEMEKAGALFLTDLPCIAEITVSDTWEK